ncbi:response regulator [Pseudomonas sp. MWU16-30317]|uniref:response regulator n=1 Tax=Pseudomonas sp. MWU16-30317 TaxID=2878095 RepID=UPI001CF984FA|nr:response regulator [Pseudomonas sp. MWU16-30317]
MKRWAGTTLLIGLAATAAVVLQVQSVNEAWVKTALALELGHNIQAVIAKINLYAYGLRGLRAAILATGEERFDADAFRRYEESRELQKEFPGARGFGFIQRVPQNVEASFVAKQRAGSRLDFRVRQFSPHDGDRFIVQYIGPLNDNAQALGVDIASETQRREAALTAMRTGVPQLSGPIAFMENAGGPQNSFLFLLPIYRVGSPTNTVAERDAALVGWSFAPLSISDVLADLRLERLGLQLRLGDRDPAGNYLGFYVSGASSSPPTQFSSSAVAEVFGRHWSIELVASEAYVMQMRQWSAMLFAVVGITISVLLSLLMEALYNVARRRSQSLADQARLAAIVESSADGIIGKDLHGMVTSWNRGAERIFGYSTHEAVGKYLCDLVVPEDMHAEEQAILAKIGRGEPIAHFETRRRRKNGELIDVSVAVSPIHDGAGQVVGASKTVRDIAGQKAAEAYIQGLNAQLELQVEERTAELLLAKQQADIANAAKSSFLANMSHEIRTPLNAVLGMLQLVQHTGLKPRQRDYVDKAQIAAKSLLGLLNDILDYSKIEAGKLQLEHREFLLDELLSDLAVILSSNQGEKEIEVAFDIDPALPSVLIGDSLRLQQILINLAGNALKFTTRGYVLLRIEQLQRSHERTNIRIRVIDTGIGIENGQLNHIFEGFAQAEASTSRRFGGSGLGLVICDRLVGLMGGSLKVTSKVGSGSCFWFDVTFETPQCLSIRDACLITDGGLRVLVADDNRVVNELLGRTGQALGWQVDLVFDGVQAVEAVRLAFEKGQPYDVVLMDWKMPNLDGLSAAKIISDNGRSNVAPVVIMISAYGREELEDAQQYEMTALVNFLTKPVTPRQLAAAVKLAKEGPGSVVLPTRVRAERHERLVGLRLLVVEDNPVNRQVAAELLRREGAIVHLAEGGLEGVALTFEAMVPFDVIIMDVQMPDIDGYEATRRIRARREFIDLPILAMTANASSADREQCLVAGMSEHIGKPIDIEQLVSTVLGLINGKRAPLTGENVTHTADPFYPIESPLSLLDRFGGDLLLILQTLESYRNDASMLLGQLDTATESGSLSKVRAILHTLRGSSATIGASALYQRLGTIECALMANNRPELEALLSVQARADLTQLLMVCTESLAEWIEKTLGHPSKDEVSITAKASGSRIDNWYGGLKDILPVLRSGNMQALEMMEVLKYLYPVDDEVKALQFIEQVQALRFDDAIVTLDYLLKREGV